MRKDSFEVYRLHIPEIDDEHQAIFDLINRIEDLLKSEASHEKIRPLSMELFDFTRKHIVHEEAMMEKIGFPFVLYHKQEHVRILHEIERLEKVVQTNLHEYMTSTFNTMFASHIDHYDFQYKEFYQKWLARQI